ncbi:hypothetical protein [Aureimonas sp. AU4]|uniref:hypothetical protein n=1 Tax=Aureimonas sp. AU4 TaxID=1638163 RepID=UPI000A9923FC|nr:hypothetical protein [Aureimonas sp. AU4]
MRYVVGLAALAVALAAPALAQTTPVTSSGSASSTPADGAEEVLPAPSGGTSGTVELPGGGTVTESRPAAEQAGQGGRATGQGSDSSGNRPAEASTGNPPAKPN